MIFLAFLILLLVFVWLTYKTDKKERERIEERVTDLEDALSRHIAVGQVASADTDGIEYNSSE